MQPVKVAAARSTAAARADMVIMMDSLRRWLWALRPSDTQSLSSHDAATTARDNR